MHPIARHLALLSVALLGSTAALAQSFPTKPIRAVVPFAAGSATDQIGRAFAEKMSATLGQPVIVDNKPGASGMLGAAEVAKAAPDGYTLTLAAAGFMAVNPSLYAKLPYDNRNDLAAVSLIGVSPLVAAVNNDAPFKNAKELVAYAKQNPGKVSFGSSGNGAAAHLTTELLKTLTQTDMVHIPCLLYTSPSPRDRTRSRMPSSA